LINNHQGRWHASLPMVGWGSGWLVHTSLDIAVVFCTILALFLYFWCTVHTMYKRSSDLINIYSYSSWLGSVVAW